MKPFFQMAFFAVFALFTACHQNAPAPAPPVPVEPPQMTGTDNNDGKGVYISSVTIEDAGPVVRDPVTTALSIDRRKEGDLQPLFLTKTTTQMVDGKKTVVGPFSLTAESAAKAVALMEKVGALKETEYKPANPMVGMGPKTFTIGRSNASTPGRITVLPGSKPDAALVELEKLLTDEMTSYLEFQKSTLAKTVAGLEGKVWQSDTDKDYRISFRGGQMFTWHGDKEDAAKPYTSFRRWCPDGCGRMTKKNEGEGMKAGFICCMTLTGQDDACYLIVDASAKTLEYMGTGPDAKSESFTLLQRK